MMEEEAASSALQRRGGAQAGADGPALPGKAGWSGARKEGALDGPAVPGERGSSDARKEKASEAELSRARALCRLASGDEAYELQVALERALTALEGGTGVESVLAEMLDGHAAPSALVAPAGSGLATLVVSTFRPESFDPSDTFASRAGGKSFHDRFVMLCSQPWFERAFLLVFAATFVLGEACFCGVGMPIVANAFGASSALLGSFVGVFMQICSVQ